LKYKIYFFTNKAEGISKKAIFHFARCAFVLDNAPRSCPQNGVTSYATFVCWPGFTYRAFIIACSGFCSVLRSNQRLPRHSKRSSNGYLHSRNASQLAVVMAAVFNFFGVLLGGLSVAYAIVHMLPTDLLLNVSSGHGLAMVFSMLLAAIIWNLGTWYFGLPASSSHTLIGAIIGIGLTNALMTGTSVVDALEHPESDGDFCLTYRLPYRGSGGSRWIDFHPASLLEQYQKTLPYSPDTGRA
jgi:low-affinity inorganic phosphate transporter